MTEADTVAGEVLKAHEAWLAAVATRDPQALDRLICEDLIYVHASGRTQDKAAYMKDAVERGRRQNFTGLEVRSFGDTAVITCVMVAEPGTANVDVTLLLVWVKDGDVWKLAARQAMQPRVVS